VRRAQNVYEDQLVEVATLGRALPEQSVPLLCRLLGERTQHLAQVLQAVRAGDRAAGTPAAGAFVRTTQDGG